MIDRLKNVGHLFFHFEEEAQFHNLFWGWMLFLYISGLSLWGMFLNWGNFDFIVQDWYEITGPRLYFLKDAIMAGVLPLHMTGTSALVLLTDRFLSIPDQLLSPQVLLLKFMNPAVFVLANWLVLYTVGFAGLLVFSRNYRLSPFAATIIFLLFNFNGQIEAHLSIGHITWGGYFLFPWFVLFILELQDKKIQWRWAIKVAGLLFIIFLQGSFHQFVWGLIFLGFLVFVFPKQFWAIIMAGVFACLFSAIRIFPAILIAGNVNQEFLGGFPGAWELLLGFVQIRDPAVMVQGLVHPTYVWEYDFYLGAVGSIFLAVFGVQQWLTKSTFSVRFLIPITALLLLSLGGTYEIIRVIPLPIFDGERMTTRLLSLPLVFLILFAGVHFQNWFNQLDRRPYHYLLLLLGLGILGSDLWTHFLMWQVSSIFTLFAGQYTFNPAAWVQANYVDSLYTGMLRRGLIITGLSLVLGAGMAWFNPPVGISLHFFRNIFRRLHLFGRHI